MSKSNETTEKASIWPGGVVSGLAAAGALWLAPGYWSVPAATAAFVVTARRMYGR